jgi:hypothetical protein
VSIKEELETIRNQHNGVLHPEHVLEYAKAHADSALHGKFEWNDKKAAHAHRLQTARQVIQMHIKVIDTARGKRPVRMYFAPVPEMTPQPGGYVSTADKMASPDGRAEIGLMVLKRMEAHYLNYPLDELSPVVAEIHAVRAMFEQQLGLLEVEAA